MLSRKNAPEAAKFYAWQSENRYKTIKTRVAYPLHRLYAPVIFRANADDPKKDQSSSLPNRSFATIAVDVTVCCWAC